MRGAGVHELALDENVRQPALLGAVDRLLAVSRTAPGATALFPGPCGVREYPDSGRGPAGLSGMRMTRMKQKRMKQTLDLHRHCSRAPLAQAA